MNPGLAITRSSEVKASRRVLNRVLPSDELRAATIVWSRSSASPAAARVRVRPAGNWLDSSACSRSQRTFQVWPALIWWSKRTSVFQTRSWVVVVAVRSGRAGMLMVRASSTTRRSTLAKKWALFLTTGPPTVKPYCWKVVSGLGRFVLPGEEVLPGQGRVLQESEGAAVEGVGALLGDGVHDRARRPRELRVELAGQDLELLHRLDRDARLGPGPLSGDVVVVVAAVQHEVVVAGVLPVGDDGVLGERTARARDRDHARQQGDEADEAAVEAGQVGQLAAGDVAAHLLGGDVDERRLRGDRELLVGPAHLEADVHGGGLAHLQTHAPARVPLEPRPLGGELVHAGRHAAQEIGAVRAGDDLAEHARLLVPEHDRDVRAARPPGRPAHGPGSRPRPAGRPRAGRRPSKA